PSGRYNRDEELGAVGIGTGVRHGQFARLVKFMGRVFGLVLELISWAACARALRISALDHEVRDYAVENRAIVQPVVGFLASATMLPFALTPGEFHEVGYGPGSVFVKESANDLAFRSLESGVLSWLTSHKVLSKRH